MASLENTEAKEEYSGGRVAFGLDFSAAAASSVAVVSLAMMGDPAGIKCDPRQMIRWMARFCLARVMYSLSVSQLL